MVLPPGSRRSHAERALASIAELPAGFHAAAEAFEETIGSA